MKEPHAPVAYSIAITAEVCNVGRTTLYGAIKRGELETCKVGRRRLVTDEALRKWLNAMRCNDSN